MKVLHIFRETTTGEVGGVQAHVKYLAQAQAHAGNEVSILVFKNATQGNLTTRFSEGVQWYFLDIEDRLLKTAQRLSFLRKGKLEFLFIVIGRIRHNARVQKKIELIETLAPDIIHQHDYLSSVRLSQHVSRKFNTVFTNHYGEYLLLEKNIFTQYWQNNFFARFKFIIGPSQNLLPKKNSYYVPNGFNLEIFKPIGIQQKSMLKTQMGFRDKVVFLCARRWAPNKGVLYLAQALNLIEDSIKQQSIFLFAGNGDQDYLDYQKKILGELLQSKNLNYQILGNLSHAQLSEYIKTSDVGIIPSLVEGMSLSSIELVACGIPVLATDVGGLPEIIREKENGWLVPPGNSRALAQHITTIVAQWPHSNLEIKSEDFREKYSWKKIAEQTLNLYKKTLPL